MSPGEIPLARPIEEKIAWVHACHERERARLLGDEKVKALLKGLSSAIRASAREMAGLSIPETCRSCEEKEGGSCCGIGLEDRYGGTLLLINLLLGVELPQERHDPRSCFFLGPSGCRLKARDVICVNYLCPRITARIPPEEIAALREKEGVELTRLFLLNERIRQMLRTRSSGDRA